MQEKLNLEVTSSVDEVAIFVLSIFLVYRYVLILYAYIFANTVINKSLKKLWITTMLMTGVVNLPQALSIHYFEELFPPIFCIVILTFVVQIVYAIYYHRIPNALIYRFFVVQHYEGVQYSWISRSYIKKELKKGFSDSIKLDGITNEGKD
jgi:hypothetical protein